MSYILDALKKSAKERKRGNLPDMLTVQDIVVEKPEKGLPWPYLLTAALLLNAGLLVWWLAFSHMGKAKNEQTVKTSSPVVAGNALREVSDAAKPSMDSSPQLRSELGPVERTSAPVIEVKPSDTSVKDPVRVIGAKEVAGTRREISPHQPVAVNDTRVARESNPAKLNQAEGNPLPTESSRGLPDILDENKIYRLSELPLSIRQGLPAFSISALLYSSDSASRMVSINDQMMHEGEFLNGGVKVEEITRDGVVFRHQKIRFRVNLK